MNMWSAIVLIVVIVSLARIARARDLMKHGIIDGRHRRGRIPASSFDDTAKAELQREVEALRERVKVLERIATEERHSRQIADEIEALRDR